MKKQHTMVYVAERSNMSFNDQAFLALEHLHALKSAITRGQNDITKLANLAEQYGLQDEVGSMGMIHKMELQIVEQLRNML